MNGSLRRAARYALKPNAIIFGAATCLFGWSLTEVMRWQGESEYAYVEYWDILFLTYVLLMAAAALLTRRALANLLAASVSGALPLLHAFVFFTIPAHREVTFLSALHFEAWLDELARVPVSMWLMTGLSFAILCSASAAVIRQTPARP